LPTRARAWRKIAEESRRLVEIDPRFGEGVPAPSPCKKRRRDRHVITVPMRWHGLLAGCKSGAVWQIAQWLLYQHWREYHESRGGRGPIKLANVALRGTMHRRTKWRALEELERRGLIEIERRPRKSPLVWLNMSHHPGEES
jgi:hypothetical protein